MKIIRFCLLACCVAVIPAFGSMKSCSEIQSAQGFVPDDQKGRFAYEYNLALCEVWAPLHEEARAYIHALRDRRDTSPEELIYEIGNTFCRGLYGTCDHTSFYARFVAGCSQARSLAVSHIESTGIRVSADLFGASFVENTCGQLADTTLRAYKDAASIEIARWNMTQKQLADTAYFQKNTEKANALLTKIDTFKKKMVNFVRSFQGFIKQVYGA